MYRGQKAQDHENFEADTRMADNRRADHRRWARVDRTRDFYRGRAHFLVRQSKSMSAMTQRGPHAGTGLLPC